MSVVAFMGLFQAGMFHIPPSETSTWNGYNKKSPFSFFIDIFKRKKPHDDQSNVEFEDPSFIGDMERSSEHHSKWRHQNT
jgi:hypothetical protein